MLGRHSLDDDTTEDLLAGRDPGQADLTMIVSFLADVRAVTHRPAPEVAPRLAALMGDGVSSGNTDVLVRAASDVPGPEAEAAELPGRRRKKLALAQTLTGLGVRAKAAIGLG